MDGVQATDHVIAGLSELVLMVNDVQQAAQFYRDVVGLIPEEGAA